MELSLTAGTTLIGDICTKIAAMGAGSRTNLRRVFFQEILAWTTGQADEIIKGLNSSLRKASRYPLLEYGISPHAPYTVSPTLYRRTAQFARVHGCILATHVAETRAEIQFLQTGKGELGEFLSAVGSLPAGWRPPKLAPIPYLDSLGVLGPNCLLIHCNYLDRESIARIASAGASVVYCPRSHEFFGHDHHPVRELIDFGINVALGTDSLASNNSLSMLDEMRFLYRKRKDISPQEILRAATVNGAQALKYGSRLGRLKPGYQADMTVLEIPTNLTARRLISQLLEGAGECIATVVNGQIAWQRAPSHSKARSPSS